MDVREKMIQYRAKHNLSQADFAKEVGLAHLTICRIETGKSLGRRTTLAKIMNAIKKGDENDTL